MHMFIYFLDPTHKQKTTIMVTNNNINMREINTINVNKNMAILRIHTLLRWSTAPPIGKDQTAVFLPYRVFKYKVIA